MELVNYLQQHFYDKGEFVKRTRLSAKKLAHLQQLNIMPLASYRVMMSVTCDSFLGDYHKEQCLEYYAKGYLSWCCAISKLTEERQAKLLFTERYKFKALQLQQTGFTCFANKLPDDFNTVIEQEWHLFLQGTYGVCTRTGLPEDIATKELTAMLIKQLTQQASLNSTEKDKLEKTVNLLDSASALFAPHERANSSREKLINQVRKDYQLSINL